METAIRRRPDPQLHVRYYRGAWRWACHLENLVDDKNPIAVFFRVQNIPHAMSDPAGCYDAAEANEQAMDHHRREHLVEGLRYGPSYREQRLAELRATRRRHRRPPDPTPGDDQT